MFTTLTDEFTHMAYITYDKLGQKTYFFCKQVMGFWKIFYSLDGSKIEKLTSFADDVTECSPYAEWENGNWQISFIAGGGVQDRTFYLYKQTGLDGEPIKIGKADFGFYSAPRTVKGLRSNVFTIDDNGAETEYSIPQAEYIYRITHIPQDFNQLVITGQFAETQDLFTWIFNLENKEIHTVIVDGGLVPYKACFFKGKCYYAYKDQGNGFEERHIKQAETVQFVKLDSSKIIAKTIEKPQMACVDCLRKHLSSALAYGKEILKGHGAGGHPDHRVDFQGEIVNAEAHATFLDTNFAQRIRVLRKSFEREFFVPQQKQLDEIRTLWNDSYSINSCGCSK